MIITSKNKMVELPDKTLVNRNAIVYAKIEDDNTLMLELLGGKQLTVHPSQNTDGLQIRLGLGFAKDGFVVDYNITEEAIFEPLAKKLDEQEEARELTDKIMNDIYENSLD